MVSHTPTLRATGIALLCTILLSSCQEINELLGLKRKNADGIETVTTTYPSGRLKSRMEVKDSLRHGTTKEYYESGKLKKIMEFENNRRIGTHIQYYPDGQVRAEISYVNNKRNGKALSYFENGKLYIEENYVSGKLHGKKTKYNSLGKIRSSQSYIEGRPQNDLKEYSKSGKLVEWKPKLNIKEVDRIHLDGTYTLEIQFSKKSSKDRYFLIKDPNSLDLLKDAVPIRTVSGIAYLDYYPKPGTVKLEKLYILGVKRTVNKNDLMVYKKFNLAIKY